MTRHASVHAAGVVIAPKAITEYAPLYKGARDEIVDAVVDEGDRARRPPEDGLPRPEHADAHRRRHRRDQADDRRSTLDIDDVPLDDAKTYQIFQDGQTYGIFQFESSGMRDILRKAKPQRLDDLIALNALYRPGPLRSGMVDDFIARKQGKTEVKYELPELEPILAETYGVIAYQEQVMRISNVARRLHARRSRPAAQGDGQEERRGDGEAARQVRRRREEATASARRRPRSIFDLMEHFAGYGFNKSHSTAYAFLAYQTAYLKANYPWHFAAALLTIESQNTDKLALYLGECRERGIPVLPPDINESQLRFTVEPGKGVRFGLTAIKNVGEGAIESLLERAREAGAHHVAARALRGSRSAAGQQARVREPGQGRRVRFARASAIRRYEALPTPRCAPRLLAAVDAACEHGARMQRDRERRAGAALRRLRRRPTAAAHGGRGAAAGGDAVDRDRAARASRRKRSASTGAAIRSIAIAGELKEFGAQTDRASSPTPAGRRRRGDAWGPGGRKPIEPDTQRRRHHRRRAGS